MRKYIGHPMQLYGVKTVRIEGGKGDGMKLLQVNNAAGLSFAVSADRCADISELSFKGVNFAYISPCGYVSPKYYDNKGAGFLKSFTAGFMTTCGFSNVGSPNTDDGEELGLHGNISNTPCENISYNIDDEKIVIKATVRDATIFNHQYVLEREYVCPLYENVIYVTDTITNVGSKTSPLEVLYHCNMGYPLLSEDSIVKIPTLSVTPRNEHSASGIDNCLVMEKPQNDYEEMCFYHEMKGETNVSIYNPKINKGLVMEYNSDELSYFTEWKMMGEKEYVLGLEPGNCTPDGRNIMREQGRLEFLKPGEKKIHHLKFTFIEEN